MKESKYKAKKITYDGITFDSIKECGRYKQLKWREKAKEIINLELQPKFILQEKFKYANETHRSIMYKADFQYFDKIKDCVIVEDVKGYKTEVYKIKKKLLLCKYPGICFKEI